MQTKLMARDINGQKSVNEDSKYQLKEYTFKYSVGIVLGHRSKIIQ